MPLDQSVNTEFEKMKHKILYFLMVLILFMIFNLREK